MTADATNLTKLVLLIDGENLDSKFAPDLMRRATQIGTLVEKRVYGQKDNTRIPKWEKLRTEYGLTMIDVSKISREKDSADFKLVVEAMDMLHGRQLDGFCVASSDGDFSALAERVLANALSFYGLGEGKAPQPYKKRCTQFIELTAAKKAATSAPAPKKAQSQVKTPAKPVSPKKPPPAKPQASKPATPKPSTQPRAAPFPVPLDASMAAIDKAKGLDGWTHSRDLGNELSRSGFSPGALKYTVKQLVKAYPQDVATEKRGNDTFVRRKPR